MDKESVAADMLEKIRKLLTLRRSEAPAPEESISRTLLPELKLTEVIKMQMEAEFEDHYSERSFELNVLPLLSRNTLSIGVRFKKVLDIKPVKHGVEAADVSPPDRFYVSTEVLPEFIIGYDFTAKELEEISKILILKEDESWVASNPDIAYLALGKEERLHGLSRYIRCGVAQRMLKHASTYREPENE